MPGDVGDVLGRLEPALDLQAGDAQLDQLGDQVVRREVLRAEEVLRLAEVDVLAVADDLIGHPAGLGALAAVGRPAAEGLAGQALARIGHAERAVDEDLDRHVGLGRGPCAISSSDSSRARITREQPSSAASRDPFLAGDRHLGRGVDLQVGSDGPDQPGQAQVLDDHRVDARHGQLADRRFDLGQLGREDQRIERDVASHPAAVEQRHDLGQVGPFEVGRATRVRCAWSPK